MSSYGISSIDTSICLMKTMIIEGHWISVSTYFPVKTIITDKQEEYQFADVTMYEMMYGQDGIDENDSSLTQYFNLRGTWFFFTGDISRTMESTLIDRSMKVYCDVVKLSHHGSDTGNSQSLFNVTQPTLAIVSSGKNNRYHHPSKEVVQRLLDNRIEYVNTADEGSISIYCLGFGYIVVTQSGKVRFSFNRYHKF